MTLLVQGCCFFKQHPFLFLPLITPFSKVSFCSIFTGSFPSNRRLGTKKVNSLTQNKFGYYNALNTWKRKMKGTIELSDDQKKALRPLVVERGLRDYSKVVQEAIDFYVKARVERRKPVKQLLKMRGTWSRGEARQFRRRIEGTRRNWKIS